MLADGNLLGAQRLQPVHKRGGARDPDAKGHSVDQHALRMLVPVRQARTVPKTTSKLPVCADNASAHAACTRVFGVTPHEAANCRSRSQPAASMVISRSRCGPNTCRSPRKPDDGIRARTPGGPAAREGPASPRPRAALARTSPRRRAHGPSSRARSPRRRPSTALAGSKSCDRSPGNERASRMMWCTLHTMR